MDFIHNPWAWSHQLLTHSLSRYALMNGISVVWYLFYSEVYIAWDDIVVHNCVSCLCALHNIISEICSHDAQLLSCNGSLFAHANCAFYCCIMYSGWIIREITRRSDCCQIIDYWWYRILFVASFVSRYSLRYNIAIYWVFWYIIHYCQF